MNLFLLRACPLRKEAHDWQVPTSNETPNSRPNCWRDEQFVPWGIATIFCLSPLNRENHPHWHLDYLRQSIPLSQIWYSENKLVLEHHWASIMSHWDGISIPMKKFGASDCKCSTHLFHLNQPLEFNEFQKKHSDILKQHNDLKQVVIWIDMKTSGGIFNIWILWNGPVFPVSVFSIGESIPQFP